MGSHFVAVPSKPCQNSKGAHRLRKLGIINGGKFFRGKKTGLITPLLTLFFKNKIVVGNFLLVLLPQMCPATTRKVKRKKSSLACSKYFN